MRLVSGMPTVRLKTYWCTKCNRFTDSLPNRVPLCPVHGVPMVDDPADPRRVEPDAPFEDKSRKPPPRRNDPAEISRWKQALAQVSSTSSIPVIANAEDVDLKNDVTNELMARGLQVSVSIQEPRHRWSGRLDPNWVKKFKPVLEQCEIAVYARRRGSLPNPATALELEILQRAGKKVFIYEPDV
jgi:hypothetical protein